MIAVSGVLEAALGYARLGWLVFPVHTVLQSRDGPQCSCGRSDCSSVGKHPRTKHGCRDATADPDRIKAWWHEWPEANIGIQTGEESGLVVLDVDPRHGGAESLARLEKVHGSMPETAEALTGGGGRHVLFRHPGEKIPNAVGFLPGLDVRADGAYIVATPSVHASGRRYSWASPVDRALAPLPPWLSDLMAKKAGRTQPKPAVERLIPVGRRHDILRSRSFALGKLGLRAPEILAMLRGLRDERCVDAASISDKEIEDLATSAGQEGGREITDPDELRRGLVDATRDLPALRADETPPRPVILGNGLLRARWIGQLHGPDGSRKSWVLLHLAVAAACGHDWFGIPTRARGLRVGFIGLEDDKWIVQPRLEAILAESGADEKLVEQNLRLIIPPYHDEPMLDIIDPSGLQALLEWTRGERIELLLLDHLSRLHALTDERDLRPVAAALLEIARTCNAGVVVAHHDRKAPAGSRAEDSFASRGDSRFRADCRFVASTVEKGGKVRLTIEKTTGAARPQPIWLEHTGSGALRVTDEPKKASEAAAARRAQMIDELEKAGRRGLSPAELAARLEVTEKTVKGYQERMAGRVLAVGRTSGRRYILAELLRKEGSPSEELPEL
jgi:DNA-binding CsgD family transcriptional regulator